MNMLRRRSSSGAKKPNPKLIFRKFLDFLQTDHWKLPTVNFLEKNSILFNHDEANHELCVKAHQQYTELVDTLIESYCQDAATSPKDLVEAMKSTENTANDAERRLLEPVVAAQDFNVFVHLMTRINIELQLQAVKMLEHICGVQPVSFKFGEDDADMWQSLFEEDETDRYIIISVLKQSKEEFDRDEQLRKALQDAFQASLDEIQRLERQRVAEITELNNAISGASDGMRVLSVTEDKHGESAGPSSHSPNPVNLPAKSTASKSRRLSTGTKPPPAVKSPVTNTPMNVNDDKSHVSPANKFDFKNLLNKKGATDDEKLKQRAEYLRQQRDKLVEAKQKQRERKLIEAVQRNASERPRTSQAARGAIQGALNRSGLNQEEMVEARKAIANKIREQVINRTKGTQ